MALAKLTLTVPEGVWIGDLSRSHPQATIRVLAAYADDGSGIGLAEIEASDVEAVLTGLAEYDDVTTADVIRRGDGDAVVRFETTTPLLLLAVIESGVPLELPFDIEDGRAVWEVRAPRDRLSALGEQLDEFGVPYRVDFVREGVATERLLTDRQRDLLATAVETGYYDTPRKSSLTELADHVGIAKSTASETLHRAEEQVIKRYVSSVSETADDGPDGGGSADATVERF